MSRPKQHRAPTAARAAQDTLLRRAGSAPARRDWLLFGGIVLLALGLRCIYISQWRHCPIFDYPVIDEAYHDDWARAIVAGRQYVPTAYFRAPLYPFVLAGIYAVMGPSYLNPRLVQALLSALMCGVLFDMGRRLFGRVVGVMAGVAAASYWTLIFFDGELLIPPLPLFLNIVMLWLLVRGMQSPHWAWFAAAGVMLGLSAVARPNVLLFGPAAVGWLLVLHRGAWRRALVCCAWLTAGCLAAVLPVTIRNYVVGGEFVLIASQGGLNFYIGNNPESDGRTAIAPRGALDFWGSYDHAIAEAELALGRKLKASEVSDYYYDRGWEFIRTQPSLALALTWLKVRLFWTSWEIANNKNIYFWTARFAPVMKWLPVSFGIVGPLGLLGLVLCWRRRALELFPLWGFVLVYMASIVPFFCNKRYRLPVVPVLILLAAYATWEAWHALRGRRWKSTAIGAALLALAVVFVHAPVPVSLQPLPPGVPNRFRPPNEHEDFLSMILLGQVYEAKNQPAAALAEYRRALARAPGDVEAAFRLGAVLIKLNRLPEGLEDFRRVVKGPRVWRVGENPQMLAGVHSDYAMAAAFHREYAEAVMHFQEAIRLDPAGNAGGDQFNLALVLARLGRRDEARQWFERAVEVSPAMRDRYPQLARELGE